MNIFSGFAILLPALLVLTEASSPTPVGLVVVTDDVPRPTTPPTTTRSYRWPWLRPRPRPMPPMTGPPVEPQQQPKHVPLKSVVTKAKVQAWAYDVTSTLTYTNDSPNNIEAQFVFPVPDTAAVYKFEATIGNRKLKAAVENRSVAEEIYKDRVEAGQCAALLESQEGTPDVYRIMIGNVRPNEGAVVVVGYAMPIERDTETGQLSVHLPVVLNPRYVPRTTLETPGGLESIFHATVPYVAVSELPYTFSFLADIDLGPGGSNQIKDIRAGNTTDILQVTPGNRNRTAQVVLTSSFSADHDFRLLINISEEVQTKVYAEAGRPHSGESGVAAWLGYDVAAAWFEPLGSVESGESSDEYWLVVDRSGSMHGNKIRNAKTALTYFVKSLPIGCNFNIIGFGSRFDALFDRAVEYTDENVDTATNYAARLDANMGGTEILRPLQHIYRKNLSPGVAKRFIILLTDGEVSNTNQVINAARQNAATTSVYSVGIGQGASTALVNGVARVSNGVAEYVRNDNDRLQGKVVDMIKLTRMPSAKDVRLEWPVSSDYNVVLKTPEEARTVAFRGREVMQFAVLERHPSRRQSTSYGRSKLSASIGGRPLSFTVPFSLPAQRNEDDPMPLHRLAAKSELTALVDKYHANRDERMKKRAIDISKATGVLCEFTSIVAVDESGRVATDHSGKPVFVNIQRPTIYDMSPYAAAHFPLFSAKSSRRSRGRIQLSGIQMGPPGPRGRMGVFRNFADSDGMAPPPTTTPRPFGSDLDQLVLLFRSASGTWRLNQQFVGAIGSNRARTAGTLRSLAQAAIQAKAPQVNDVSLATLTAVATLRTRFAARQNEWDQVANKALAYLHHSRSGIRAGDIDDHIRRIAQALL